MKKNIIVINLLFWCLIVMGQEFLTIEECQRIAVENYPLINRYSLIEKTREYNLSNAGKGYLPQFSFTAKASYQSDVTEIPIPSLDIPSLPKDQYQFTVDLNQNIWDGGVIRSQKQIVRAQSEVEKQQLEVNLYTIKERVNQLFFGILLFDAQLDQNTILQDNLQRNLSTVKSYMENGIANQADIDAVKVEIIQASQNRIQILSNRKAYLEMLSLMMGERLSENVELVKPQLEEESTLMIVNRPELQLFASQYNLVEQQKKQLNASNLPKLGVYAQGGYGRPGLNMLERDFALYGIAGVRLSWNFGGLYTKQNDLRKLTINQQDVIIQQENFLYNISIEAAQEKNEIQKMKKVTEYDNQIIVLRENVRKAAEAKMSNGTLTVTELMREINAENSARIDKASHEIEWLLAIYKLKNTTNN